MQFNLIVNYFSAKDPERKKEIDYCFRKNLENREIGKIFVFVGREELSAFSELDKQKKAEVIIHDQRPTYNDYFGITSKNPMGLNAMCNADIFFDESTIAGLKKWSWKKDICFALSRWDLPELDVNVRESRAQLFDREDSQDTWIFFGVVPNIKAANFTPGIAGCDNAIASILQNSGFKVLNPSRTIKTFHCHATNLRNYVIGKPTEKIPPPYLYIKPTQLEELKVRTALNSFFSFELKRFFLRMSGGIKINAQG
jgi:hypothetical protein